MTINGTCVGSAPTLILSILGACMSVESVSSTGQVTELGELVHCRE